MLLSTTFQCSAEDSPGEAQREVSLVHAGAEESGVSPWKTVGGEEDGMRWSGEQSKF